MNIIDSLNHWGAQFVGFALPMLAQSSLLIGMVFALDLALRQKARAVFRYGLWILVLVKLVLPPSFAAPTGVAYWLPKNKAVQAHPITAPQVMVRYAGVPSNQAPFPPSTLPTHPKLRFAGALLLAWATVALCLTAWLLRRSRFVVRSSQQAAAAPVSPEQLIDACRQQLAIRKPVRLRLSANADSPAVCGLWQPVILIPQPLADKLSALQWRAVLLHELAHIKRGDILVHYVQTLLQIFYWWHPLLWLANAQIRRVREQAVDEMVMVQMGDQAEAYPATLLEVAKLAFKRPMLALGLVGIVESKSALAQRIERLLAGPAPKSAKLGILRLAIVAVVGALLLPMARGERKPETIAAAPKTQALSQSVAIDPLPNRPANRQDGSSGYDMVYLWTRFFMISDSDLSRLPLGKPTGMNEHRVWVLSPKETEEFINHLSQMKSLERTPPDACSGKFSGGHFAWHLAPTNQDNIVNYRTKRENGREIVTGAEIELAPPSSLSWEYSWFDLMPVKERDLLRLDFDWRIGLPARSRLKTSLQVPQGGAAVLLCPAGNNSDKDVLIILSTIPNEARSSGDENNEASSQDNQARTETERRRGKPRIWHPTIPLQSAEPPVQREALPNPFATTNLLYTGPGRQAIQNKLDRIVLDEAFFDGVALPQVLNSLSEEAARRDPDKEGINFLINPMPSGAQTTIDPATGQQIALPPPEPLDMIETLNVAPQQITIEPKFMEMPTDAAPPTSASKELGFDWFLGNTLLSQGQRSSPGGPTGLPEDKPKPVSSPTPLETRVFRLDPNTLRENLQKQMASDVSTNVVESVRRFFDGTGVNVSPPNTVYYNDRTGLLMVRAAKEEFATVEKALAILNYSPPQITIEAKFMEMPADAARKLGLDLPSPGATSDTWTRVLTAEQMQTVLRAARRVAGADILTDPKVTTLSGRQTQIQAVKIKTIVNGVKPEALTSPGAQSTNGVPAQPYVTGQIPVGPTLDMIAYVAADGYTIHLSAMPQVTEVLDAATASQFVPTVIIGAGGARPGAPITGQLPLPIFRTRKMATSADVYDGQTLVLGNPMVTVVSQLHDGESTTNTIPEVGAKRLLVFITSTIIDPAGNPIHPHGNEPFPPDRIPAQP